MGWMEVKVLGTERPLGLSGSVWVWQAWAWAWASRRHGMGCPGSSQVPGQEQNWQRPAGRQPGPAHQFHHPKNCTYLQQALQCPRRYQRTGAELTAGSSPGICYQYTPAITAVSDAQDFISTHDGPLPPA